MHDRRKQIIEQAASEKGGMLLGVMFKGMTDAQFRARCSLLDKMVADGQIELVKFHTPNGRVRPTAKGLREAGLA